MENGNPVDYNVVLADLEAKRTQLDEAIAVIKQMLGQSVVTDPAQAGKPPGAGVAGKTFIDSDEFFGMSVGDAAVKYLHMAKKPQDATQFAEALEKGGMTHTSKNFTTTITTALSRRAEKEADVVKVKRGQWGLASWYPGLRKPKKEEADKEKAPAEPAKSPTPTKHLRRADAKTSVEKELLG